MPDDAPHIPFVHLHTHSDFSLLDGAQSVKTIVSRAIDFGCPAVAVTDHGSMSSAYELMQQVKSQSKERKLATPIKGIIGCEFYVTAGQYTSHENNPIDKERYHLILLAETDEGYVNMCHLSEEAWLRGYYYKPRIDFECLRRFHKGIICLSACISGQLPRLLLANRDEEAEALAISYRDLFGPENYFIELQNHGLAEQLRVNPKLIALARKIGVGLVVTNDAHYTRREDAEAQDILVCIGTQTTINDPKRMKFENDEFYFKSPEEMAALFPECPDAVENTVKIAARCNVHLKTVDDDHANHYPEYPEPDGRDREEHLRSLCKEGLMWRFHFDPDKDEITAERQVIIDRMNYEIDIIKRMKFISYFLVVWDFLNYAARIGVPLGPGRGSGAGSMVAYLIGITHIDPLRYNLLFERFLNPARVSPPDFDIDLCERRRHEVIEYVRAKYGADRVVQIGTFGTLKAKQVIKDVARAMGRSVDEANRLCRMIPADPHMTLDIALNGNEKMKFEPNPELKALLDSEDWAAQVWKFARKLEGLNRNMSIHAAGVIIGDMQVSNVAPIACGGPAKEAITQFSAIPCEALGLLKMDFLGLKTLTLIQDTLDLVEKNTGRKIISNDIPIDDRHTYDMLNLGRTVAVFQLESSGMQKLCRQWHLSRIEDIIALLAIYRPGPMDFIPEFLGRKEGKIPLDYDVPVMEKYLAETYGIMLYQEQIMQVVQAVAGFSLGEADLLRRAIGKKKIKIMEAKFVDFKKGCAANGIDEQTATNIWDKILKFAGYGFNKSHSAAYGMLTYRTAWLKANYPAEFMAAVLTSELGNSEKLSFYLKECREMGIRILPPDVNVCDAFFSVDGPNIRFGLAAIRGVGEGIVRNIIAEREANGRFKDLLDFCGRIKGVSVRLLEPLIQSGALDSFGQRRSQLLAVSADAVAQSTAARKDREAGQLSLFDMMGGGGDNVNSLHYPDLPELPLRDKLDAEKHMTGFYLSGHPIDQAREIVDTFQLDDLADLPELPDGTIFRTGAFLSGATGKVAKTSQKPFMILNLESRESSVETMLFTREMERAQRECPEALEPGNVVFVEGEIGHTDDDSAKLRLRINRIVPASKAPELYTGRITLFVKEEDATAEKLERLAAICDKHHGPAQITIGMKRANGDCIYFRPQGLAVRPVPKFIEVTDSLFGAGAASLRGNRNRPQPRQRGEWRQAAE